MESQKRRFTYLKDTKLAMCEKYISLLHSFRHIKPMFSMFKLHSTCLQDCKYNNLYNEK